MFKNKISNILYCDFDYNIVKYIMLNCFTISIQQHAQNQSVPVCSCHKRFAYKGEKAQVEGKTKDNTYT